VNSHRVKFRVKDPKQFDMTQIEEAMQGQGFNEASLIAGP
jgi:hypothetical protein